MYDFQFAGWGIENKANKNEVSGYKNRIGKMNEKHSASENPPKVLLQKTIKTSGYLVNLL